MSARIRRLAPLLIAMAVLVFVLRRTNFDDLRAAVAHAPYGQLLAFSAVMAVVNCAADTLAMYYVFRWFGLHLRFLDLYTIRAATYLLAVINYHAGQLGIIGFLHRVGRIPLSQASGWILFIIGVWVGMLLLLASGGAFLGGPQARVLLPVLAAFGVGLIVYVIILVVQPRFLREPPPPPVAELTRMARLSHRAWTVLQALLAPLLQAGLLGHVRAFLIRLPHLAVLIVWHFVALHAFGINIPFLKAMLYLPVVFAVASLPISVQGLGTSQAAALYFFSGFVTDQAHANEAVLAYSLSMTAISILSSLVIGLAFLQRGAKLGLSVSQAAEAPSPVTDVGPLPSTSAGP